MDKIKLVRQLAQRMGTSVEVAAQWLEAVQEVKSAALCDTQADEAVEGMFAAVLLPMTPESQNAIQAEELEMRYFPFRIGREGRINESELTAQMRNRRSTRCRANNDRYLHDTGIPLNISREHFQIEQAENGSFALVDRGSTCGTIVSGTTVGGEHTVGKCSLVDGDTIVVGTPESPYIFEFVIHSHG